MKTIGIESTFRLPLLTAVLFGLVLALAPHGVRAQSDDEIQQVVSFRVEPAIADLRGDGRGKGLWLIASGLKANQTVEVYVSMYGADSDISYMLSSAPKANSEGALATSWEIRAKRFSRVMGDQLTFQLREPKTQKVLATSPVAVCRDVKGAEAPWCAAAQPLLPIGKKAKKKKKKS